MISKYIYKKILRKINLNKGELFILKNKLTSKNICTGPFVEGKKMCPNTTALSIKFKRKLKDNKIVSEHFKNLSVNKIYLWLFYITFDIPAMLSKGFFEKRLGDFREVVDELLEK